MPPIVQRVLSALVALVLIVASYTLLGGTQFQTPVAAAGMFLLGLLFPQVAKTTLLLLVVLPALTACSGSSEETQKWIDAGKIVNDRLAQELCAKQQASAQSIDLEKARELYCKTGPLLDAALLLVLANPNGAIASVAEAPAVVGVAAVSNCGGAPPALPAGAGGG